MNRSSKSQDIQDQSPIFFCGSFYGEALSNFDELSHGKFCGCFFLSWDEAVDSALAGLHPRIPGLLSRGCLRYCSISSGVGRACGWLGSAASSHQVFVSKWRIYRQFDGQFHARGLRSHKISRCFIQTKYSDVQRQKLFLVQQQQHGHVQQRKGRDIQISRIKGADKIEILNNPEAYKFAQRGPWGLHFFVEIPKEIEKNITVLYRRIVLFSFFLVGC